MAGVFSEFLLSGNIIDRQMDGWTDRIGLKLISVAVDITHVGFSFPDTLPSSLYKRRMKRNSSNSLNLG